METARDEIQPMHRVIICHYKNSYEPSRIESNVSFRFLIEILHVCCILTVNWLLFWLLHCRLGVFHRRKRENDLGVLFRSVRGDRPVLVRAAMENGLCYSRYTLGLVEPTFFCPFFLVGRKFPGMANLEHEEQMEVRFVKGIGWIWLVSSQEGQKIEMENSRLNQPGFN